MVRPLSRLHLLEHPRFLIWIAFAYLFFVWLSSVLLTGDQKTYISIAQEMYRAGEWLQPQLFGEPNYLKPPLQYWATLVSWNLLGISPFSTVLPSVLALLGTCAFVGAIARELKIKLTRAPLLFAGTFGAITYGLSAQMEIYLVLLASGAWWMMLRALQGAGAGWIYGAWALAGLLSLLKSPLHSVLWAASFGIYLSLNPALFRSAWKRARAHHLIAPALGAVLGASWFLAIWAVDREKFLDVYVRYESIQKMSGNGSTAFQMWGAFLVASLPTVLFLPFVWARKIPKAQWTLLLAWTLPPAVFFSLFPYRTETYLFVLSPVLALWLDFACVKKEPSRWSYRLITLVLLIAAMVLVYALGISRLLAPFSVTLVALFFVCASVLYVFGNWRYAAFSAVFLVLGVRTGVHALGEKDTHDLQAFLRSRPHAEIVMLDPHRNIWHERGWLALLSGNPGKRVETEDEFLDEVRAGKIGIRDDGLPPFQQPGFQVRPWYRLKRRVQFPTQELLKNPKPEQLLRRFEIVYL